MGIRCDTLGAASCRSVRLGEGGCFNDLLGGEDSSCSATFLTAAGSSLRWLWSAGASWLTAEGCSNEVKVQLFQKHWLRLFICPPYTLRNNFSVVNILRGKSSSASITERSPLLRFSQDDRWVKVNPHQVLSTSSPQTSPCCYRKGKLKKKKKQTTVSEVSLTSDVKFTPLSRGHEGSNTTESKPHVIEPLLFCCSSSLTYMTIHERGFAGGEEHWGNSFLDLERRYRLGSEVNSLSLSRSSSSDRNDPLENFRLTSNIKWEPCKSSRAASTQFLLNTHNRGHKPPTEPCNRTLCKWFISLSSPAPQMLHQNLQSGNNIHHGGSLQRE